jgi:hypothetical protein
MHTACGNDVRDDFWVSQANCLNISDPDDRAECEAEAHEAQLEDQALCGEQRIARLEVCALLGEDRYDPEFDPANFVDPLQIGSSVAANPYHPLVPGFTRVYESGDETITVTVTDETVEILGVTCIVVKDIVEEDGEVTEDTDDWFAQDIFGNVWYCGELSRNFEDGFLADIDGSFRAGVEGAKPGIIMKAAPMEGDAYRQEWAPGDAEDVAEIVSTSASESAPAPGASCSDTCVQAREFSPLEPGHEEYKFHAPGIGVIVAYPVDDPAEREELVDYHF